jgi:predicted nucleic acid-binding Zn ribbon protein
LMFSTIHCSKECRKKARTKIIPPCEVCGVAKETENKTCSRACGNKLRAEKNRKRNREHRELVKLGLALKPVFKKTERGRVEYCHCCKEQLSEKTTHVRYVNEGNQYCHECRLVTDLQGLTTQVQYLKFHHGKTQKKKIKSCYDWD